MIFSLFPDYIKILFRIISGKINIIECPSSSYHRSNISLLDLILSNWHQIKVTQCVSTKFISYLSIFSPSTCFNFFWVRRIIVPADSTPLKALMKAHCLQAMKRIPSTAAKPFHKRKTSAKTSPTKWFGGCLREHMNDWDTDTTSPKFGH